MSSRLRVWSPKTVNGFGQVGADDSKGFPEQLTSLGHQGLDDLGELIGGVEDHAVGRQVVVLDVLALLVAVIAGDHVTTESDPVFEIVELLARVDGGVNGGPQDRIGDIAQQDGAVGDLKFRSPALGSPLPGHQQLATTRRDRSCDHRAKPGKVCPGMPVQTFLYDADGTDHAVELQDGMQERLGDRQLLWIDLTAPSQDELHRVGEVVHLHRESIRSLLGPGGQPRIDQFGTYFQGNVNAVEARDGDGQLDAQPTPLAFCVGPNYVVTVHAAPLQFLDDFAGRVHQDSGLGALDSTSMLAALLDGQLNGYFLILEALEEAVDDLDQDILLHPLDGGFLEKLVKLRRRAARLRQLLAPHREVFPILAQPDFQGVADRKAGPQFRALAGRFDRAMDATQIAREVVLGSFDLYMAGISRKTNDAVQVLTIVTVALGIVSAVASVLGTNFALGFFKSGTLGFVSMLLGMAALVALVLLVARRQRWI